MGQARRFAEKRRDRSSVERWGKYWVIYYIVFLSVLAFLLRRHWHALDWSDETYLFLLAAIFGVSAGAAYPGHHPGGGRAIFGVSAGAALSVTIISEFGVSIVLLIPSTYKWIKEKGHKEGLAEGRKEGHAEGLVVGLKEGHAEGLEVGLRQAHQDWAGWNERRAAAERAGLPFDEPPPSIPPSRNGQ